MFDGSRLVRIMNAVGLILKLCYLEMTRLNVGGFFVSGSVTVLVTVGKVAAVTLASALQIVCIRLISLSHQLSYITGFPLLLLLWL